MKKIGILLLAFLVSGSVMADVSTITLHNATSCVIQPNNPSVHHTAAPMTIYSFYYNSNSNEWVSYGAIAGGSSGPAALGSSPYIPAITEMLDLSYNASPWANTGTFVGLDGESYNNDFVVVEQSSKTSAPTLVTLSYNPCNSY